jgi:chromosome segregation ATPase
MLQVQSIATTMQRATLLADALGYQGAASVQQKVQGFLQQPAVEMESYKFHSESIIESLEQLKKDFRHNMQEIEAEETKSVAEYDIIKQEKTDHIKQKTTELDAARSEKSRTSSDISKSTADLTTTSADLLDNQKYLQELAEMCEARAKTWDQRSQMRADELGALTSAAAIIKSGVKESTSKATVRLAQQSSQLFRAKLVTQNQAAMEAIEAEADAADAAPSFIQKESARALVSIKRAAGWEPTYEQRQGFVQMLTATARKFKSPVFMTLANNAKSDAFEKIKHIMQEMIEKLMEEAAQEANQKGYCDKLLGDAKQKRDLAVESITELNGRMAKLEAIRNKLVEELELLNQEITTLQQKQQEATTLRDQEESENSAAIQEAEAGLEATNDAIAILHDFYRGSKNAKVDLELAQQSPMDDAPDAGFDAGEAYTGGQGESGGILGMLDVIKGDFERTIKSTHTAEAKSAKEYEKFTGETGVSIYEKRTAIDLKTKQKDDDIADLTEADEKLSAQTELLKLALQELVDIQPTCVNTGMTYDERVAAREEEVENLKKALCVIIQQQEKGLTSQAAEAECENQ